jgi:hypothetical protein
VKSKNRGGRNGTSDLHVPRVTLWQESLASSMKGPHEIECGPLFIQSKMGNRGYAVSYSPIST